MFTKHDSNSYRTVEHLVQALFEFILIHFFSVATESFTNESLGLGHLLSFPRVSLVERTVLEDLRERDFIV